MQATHAMQLYLDVCLHIEVAQGQRGGEVGGRSFSSENMDDATPGVVDKQVL